MMPKQQQHKGADPIPDGAKVVVLDNAEVVVSEATMALARALVAVIARSPAALARIAELKQQSVDQDEAIIDRSI